MATLPRAGLAGLLAVLAALALAGCGDSEADVTVDASSQADADLAAAIQTELDEYSQPFDLSSLPAGAQAQLGAVIDNFPQAAGAVTALTIADGSVEAGTDLDQTEGTLVTGRLICGAILRTIAYDDLDYPGGHRVLGTDGAVLADCTREDKNYP